MLNRFEVSEVLSAIDNFLENRALHRKDPELALSFVDQLKKMEIWFFGKIYVDNSRFLHKVLDLCQNGQQSDVRKFMAFARYSFRQLGPDRFEDCVNRSSLTSREKGMIIGYFRIGEIDHVLIHDIYKAVEAGQRGISTSDIISEEPLNNLCC